MYITFGTSVHKNPFLEPSMSQFNSVYKISNLLSLFNIHFDVSLTSCYVPHMVASLMVSYAFLIVPMPSTYSTYNSLTSLPRRYLITELFIIPSSLSSRPLTYKYSS
jgi:hypothetical protein